MKASLTLIFVIVGVAGLGVAILRPDAAQPFSLVGGVAWGCAYFSFLGGNYGKKTPLPTRRGKLKYSEKPRTYNLVYCLMAFLGVFFLAAFIVMNIYG